MLTDKAAKEKREEMGTGNDEKSTTQKGDKMDGNADMEGEDGEVGGKGVGNSGGFPPALGDSNVDKVGGLSVEFVIMARQKGWTDGGATREYKRRGGEEK